MAGTTTADFLKWERKAQVSFIQISILMTGTITSQIQPKIARCIDNWYFQTKELQSKRNEEILNVMPQYKKYDPTAFMLGYIESVCGKLNGK